MSIAEEEKRINGILSNSKQRLAQVQDELGMFRNEKQSIEEDIAILTQRAENISQQLGRKKKALNEVARVTGEAEEAHRKLRESTRLLVLSVKKQIAEAADIIAGRSHSDEEDK